MKHWNALNSVETEIIRISEFKNLMNLIANGTDGSTHEQLTSGIFTLLGMIEDIDEKLSENFQQLWDEIRTEDTEQTCGGDCENCECETINLTGDNMGVNWDFGAGTFTVGVPTGAVGASDTITITGLDPDYGDHGGGSTLDDYPNIKADIESKQRWTHIVNELSTFADKNRK